MKLVFDGGAWDEARLAEEVAGWRARLSALPVGARVGVLGWNSPTQVALFLACAEAGLVFVPFNARLTRSEREPLIAAAGLAVFLEDPLEHGGVGQEKAACPLFRDEPLAGLFTSGTTGTPSLVLLSHANFRASALASAANLGGDADQRWLLCLPLFHVGGLAMAHRCAQYGATLVVERAFDAARTNALIDSGGVTHVSLVPTALDRVLELRGDRRFPSTLRAMLIGGGPVPHALMQRARALGGPVLQTYGLTEACSQVATERPGEADGTTAGPPLPGLEVRLVDGMLEVRGPTVAGGGWLKTKDLATIDGQGRVTILARRTDLIVSGGENVYPAELERVLAGHPNVKEVAVGARDDATWGQVPVAVIAWRAQPIDLGPWCRERLAGFKVPRAFISADSLPRNVNGKVDRAALRALIAARNGAGPPA